jgi:hypothetical protein
MRRLGETPDGVEREHGQRVADEYQMASPPDESPHTRVIGNFEAALKRSQEKSFMSPLSTPERRR